MSAVHTQIASRIVKAGPKNITVYMTGMAIMYKEHQILVEVNNDGSGIICKSSLPFFKCTSKLLDCGYSRELKEKCWLCSDC